AVTAIGASAPAITSAVATAWAQERRGCRIASSPRFQARKLAPDLVRSTARKKGLGLYSRARRVRWGDGRKACSARWRACATRHRPESAEEKQPRSRGVGGRGRQSHDERERYNLRQRYAEGVCLTPMPISGACYSRMTEDQGAVGNNRDGRSHSDCSGGDLH